VQLGTGDCREPGLIGNYKRSNCLRESDHFGRGLQREGADYTEREFQALTKELLQGT